MTVSLEDLCRRGRSDEAIYAAESMIHNGISVSRNDAYCLLESCIKRIDASCGRRVQSLMLYSGIASVAALNNVLIRLFSYTGSLLEANQVFCNIRIPSIYTWNSIISANANLGESGTVLDLNHKLYLSGVGSNEYIYSALLKACAVSAALHEGRLIHGHLTNNWLDLDVAVGNSLVYMYAKCGALEEAHSVFENLGTLNVISWSSMIDAYVQHGHGFSAINLYIRMQLEGIMPDKITFFSIIRACNIVCFVQQGRLVHGQIVRAGLELDVMIRNVLVGMYGKCGCMDEAIKIFNKPYNEDAMMWDIMVTAYAQHGDNVSALKLFEEMQYVGIAPQEVTFSSILIACSEIGALTQGRLIHEQMTNSGLVCDAVLGSGLIEMYAKCGSPGEAHIVFEALQNRDLVCWTMMIAAYAQFGQGLLALEVFEQMCQDGAKPDKVTLLGISKGCANAGALIQGRLIHEQIITSQFESDMATGSALVDMYAKCGSLMEAFKVFVRLPNLNVVSWGAMIAGFAQCGNSQIAGKCLEDMQRKGVKADAVTHSKILLACSHAGLENEGYMYFESISEDQCMAPNVYHYICLVDLLGRAGCLNEAEDVLQTIEPNAIGWRSLLSSCKTYGNLEIGRRCFDKVIQLEPNDTACYMLMSNLYSDNDRQKLKL